MQENLPCCSPRNSLGCPRSCLRKNPGSSLERNVDWDSGLNSGENGACYSARNRARSCPCCSPRSGRSSGGNSRTSSSPRSSGSSLASDSESSAVSYGVGIGGGRTASEDRGLRIEELGQKSAAHRMCAIIHIQEVECSQCAPRRTAASSRQRVGLTSGPAGIFSGAMGTSPPKLIGDLNPSASCIEARHRGSEPT